MCPCCWAQAARCLISGSASKRCSVPAAESQTSWLGCGQCYLRKTGIPGLEEREMREEERGRTKKWISLLDWGKWREGTGVGRKGWSDIPCRLSAIALSGSALGCRNQDFCLFLGKTSRPRREKTLFEIMSYPLWHKMPRVNCQASDLTEMSLGKLDRNEQSLVTPAPHHFSKAWCCFEPPGKECWGAHMAGGRSLIFATLAGIYVFCCFLLCLWNAVTNFSCAFWRTYSFRKAFFEIP